MPEAMRNILICSCEGTMPLDGEAVRRGCRGGAVTTARQLCGAEIERFQALAAEGAPLTVGCTQEAPRFIEAAAALGRERSVQYVNIRETAGWSRDAEKAGPKMAALLAAANEPVPQAPVVSLESQGVILIYGRGEEAVEAGNLLKDHLDVTVLIRAARGRRASGGRRFPGGHGRDPRRRRPFRRVRRDGRRFRAKHAVLARRSCLRSPARRRAVALRHHPRSLGRDAAVRVRRSARRLSARVSRQSGRDLESGPERARSRRRLRQAALCRFRGRNSAPTRVRGSSAARAASTSVLPAPSRRRASMSRSTPGSAPDAASAPLFVRPGPPLMPRRRRTP